MKRLYDGRTQGVKGRNLKQVRRALLTTLAVLLALGLGTAAAGGSTARSSVTPRDRALLSSVLAGMKTDLRSIRIVDLTQGWRSPKRRDKKLLVVISAATSEAGKVLDHWYASVIAGSYNDQCVKKADHCLAAYEAEGIGGAAIGRSGAQRPFASLVSLSPQIHSDFAAVGLHVSSISFERPYALAPVVTVRTHHPRRAAYTYRQALTKVLSWPRHISGLFIRLLDARGRPFLVWGGSGNEGEVWARRGLGLRNGIGPAAP